MKIHIFIGLPPKEVKANYGRQHGSHWKVSKAKAAYKQMAFLAAKSPAVPRLQRPIKYARVQYTAYWPSNRNRMDPDNLIFAMKSALDGIVKARVLDDDREITLLPPRQRVHDSKHGGQKAAGVLVEIEEETR
jgi:Holliday junction resolvase RusA-like endonuclease